MTTASFVLKYTRSMTSRRVPHTHANPAHAKYCFLCTQGFKARQGVNTEGRDGSLDAYVSGEIVAGLDISERCHNRLLSHPPQDATIASLVPSLVPSAPIDQSPQLRENTPPDHLHDSPPHYPQTEEPCPSYDEVTRLGYLSSTYSQIPRNRHTTELTVHCTEPYELAKADFKCNNALARDIRAIVRQQTEAALEEDQDKTGIKLISKLCEVSRIITGDWKLVKELNALTITEKKQLAEDSAQFEQLVDRIADQWYEEIEKEEAVDQQRFAKPTDHGLPDWIASLPFKQVVEEGPDHAKKFNKRSNVVLEQTPELGCVVKPLLPERESAPNLPPVPKPPILPISVSNFLTPDDIPELIGPAQPFNYSFKERYELPKRLTELPELVLPEPLPVKVPDNFYACDFDEKGRRIPERELKPLDLHLEPANPKWMTDDSEELEALAAIDRESARPLCQRAPHDRAKPGPTGLSDAFAQAIPIDDLLEGFAEEDRKAAGLLFGEGADGPLMQSLPPIKYDDKQVVEWKAKERVGLPDFLVDLISQGFFCERVDDARKRSKDEDARESDSAGVVAESIGLTIEDEHPTTEQGTSDMNQVDHQISAIPSEQPQRQVVVTDQSKNSQVFQTHGSSPSDPLHFLSDQFIDALADKLEKRLSKADHRNSSAVSFDYYEDGAEQYRVGSTRTFHPSGSGALSTIEEPRLVLTDDRKVGNEYIKYVTKPFIDPTVESFIKLNDPVLVKPEPLSKETNLISPQQQEQLQTVEHGTQTLFGCVKHNRYDELRAILESDVSLVDAEDDMGNTLLHMAIANNNKRVAKLLLKSGARVGIQNKRGDTPLHVAARLKFFELSQYLIANGADDQLKNADGMTPFMLMQGL